MEPKPEQPEDAPEVNPSSDGTPPPEAPTPAGATPDPGPPVDEYKPELIQGGLFPHEVPSEHWKADFGDSRQVYQGSTLPIWLLAGWATFIIWALVYLYFGLTTF